MALQTDSNGLAEATTPIATNGDGPPEKSTAVEDELEPPKKTAKTLTRSKGLVDTLLSTEPSAGYFNCSHCNKFFWSEASLKHHSSLYHSEKSFICEICGKAFRFRSNLAEHRSVHTSLKPYVCRFCGKSSRLKGNLTKHILKHHKREQNAFIGKDDIIIKKGKKSVKDPAAVDFLEKSMIILTSEQAAMNSSSPSTTSDQLSKANKYFGAIKESAGGTGGSASRGGGQTSPMITGSCAGGSLFLPCGANDVDTDPLGASIASSDLKEGGQTGRSRRTASQAHESDVKKATGCNLGSPDGFLTSTPVSAYPGHFPYLVFDHQQQQQHANKATPAVCLDEALVKNRGVGKMFPMPGQPVVNNHNSTRCQICQKHFRKAANLALHLTVKHRFPPPKEPLTEPMSVASTCSSGVAKLNDLLLFAGSGEHEPLDLKRRLFRDTPVSSSSTIALEKLSGIAAAAAAAAAASTPIFGSAPEAPGSSLSMDMKEVKASLMQLKQTANESAKLEGLIKGLEARFAHMERQVETTSNTLFAVFHMQTEMHNAFCNFKGDMVEQLKTLLRYMRDQS
ncbi:zinc finger protein [Trichuris trichiura]|uniref:Zinc finger protein n=1 Tax=Trichuris trichiura TaxID=36087 RepID=A0A077Z140_TRITR|nr:zinc finger protein [Trichuris trichiura]